MSDNIEKAKYEKYLRDHILTVIIFEGGGAKPESYVEVLRVDTDTKCFWDYSYYNKNPDILMQNLVNYLDNHYEACNDYKQVAEKVIKEAVKPTIIDWFRQ